MSHSKCCVDFLTIIKRILANLPYNTLISKDEDET